MRTDPSTLVDVEDASLVAALRAGDESAFVWLVGTYHASFVRVARGHVPTDAVAEEVAQEAWLGVVEGIDRFEGRSSLKTWIFRVLLNIARTRGERERRTVPLSTLGCLDRPDTDEDQLLAHGSSASVGWLDVTTARWDGIPDDRAIAGEIRQVIANAIAALPASQREVVVLRDVEQLTSAEVCSTLDITQGNQRILLHRARTKVRTALVEFFRVATPVMATL